MANSFPGSGLAYADAFSVGTANAAASSLYVASSCVQAVKIEHNYNQSNLHHNTLWLRATNSGSGLAASIGFTVLNNGGDHHRANIAATANDGQIGGNLALYTRNNNGNDTLGLYINHAGNTGVGTSSPSGKFHISGGSEYPLIVDTTQRYQIGLYRCGVSEWWFATDTNGSFVIHENGVGDKLTMTAGGNVGIGTTSPIGDVKTDIRTSCSLTAPVGQPLFLGSNDVTGPLGIVIQHLCGHGVCRVDITSTRYGISGNDLSLNVDSSDPNAAGGLYIKYRGNVGIGTSAPSTKFNIRHRVDRAYTPNSYNDTLHAMHIEFCNQNQRAGLIRFTSHGNLENTFGVVQVGCAAPGCGQGDFVFQAYKEAGGSAYNELMRLTNTGNIGIGTASPSSKLDVSGADGRIQSRVDSSDGSTINVRPNAGKCGWISYTEDAVADRWGIGVKNGDSKLYFASGNVGVGGGTTRMVLDGSGNVGIGTTSPNTIFNVRAGAQGTKTDILSISTCDGAGAQPTLRFDTIQSNNNVLGRISTLDLGAYSSALVFEAATSKGGPDSVTTEVMRLVGCNGNVGIGTTSPNRKLTIRHGETDGIRVEFTGNSDNLLIDASNVQAYSGTEVCTLKLNASGGNVGVGISNPSYKLHVNGTFYAAGSSIEYKQGISQYDTDSCLFMCLKPKTYQYKDEWKHLGKDLKSGTQIGLIAEEVAEIMPELAVLVNEEENKVVRNVDYEKLSIILLSEVQKLRKEVDNLKNNK